MYIYILYYIIYNVYIYIYILYIYIFIMDFVGLFWQLKT